MMRKIRLDMTNIETVRAMHIYMRYAMDFPAYYGCNLDALHDVLAEIGEETQVTVTGMARTGEEVQRWLPAFRRVIEDAMEENPKLTFVLTED